MPLKRFITIGFAILNIPTMALAQVATPVIAPWSVDNTAAQGQIRQYETFKAIQNANNAHEIPNAPSNYEYAAPDKLSAKEAQRQSRLFQTQSHTNQTTAPSAIEQMYSDRIVDELTQFGYNLFGVPDNNVRTALSALASKAPSIPSGAVQDDFVLGENDELEITFSGQRTDRGTYKVDSQGLMLIPDFPPIPASGRTIGQVRISIETAAKQLHNTDVYISLASVRQIGILVVGHTKRPGRQTLTVFHTVLDALMEAGGVDKTGSLRQIKLVRGGRSTFVDLYGLLMHGATNMDLQLRDGDRIIVPPIGPTVAIAGEVKRPGIYEILPRSSRIIRSPQDASERLSLNEMLTFAGGILTPGNIRYLKLAATDNGLENVKEIAEDLKPEFSDGSILMVSKGQDRRAAAIHLEGHSLRSGLHALSENQNLSTLLSGTQILGPDIYPLIGVIERWDEQQLTHKLIDFPLKLVLNGKFDRALQEDDVVHLFSNA